MQIGQYFGGDRDNEFMERFARLLPIERMHAAFDGTTIVGGAGAFPFRMSMPGGALVGCAGTTVVGVSPTHRRRGVLRSMMRAQLDDAHERGESIAALWASEETIYGRFGFGRASFAGTASIPSERAALAAPLEPRGSMRLVDAEEALELFPPVWDALARERPGVFARSCDWWELRALRDGDVGTKRFAALELDGRCVGYAIYRNDFAMGEGMAESKLVVIEAVGDDTQATAEVWRYLLGVDWVANVTVALIPPDHPLFFLLAEPRRMRYRMGDGIWVRLLDVGAALSARTYAGDSEVVFEVADEFCPWNEGRWRVGAGGAERTDAAAEIGLDVRELGSASLGAIGFTELAQGGRVEEFVTGSLARADALFRAPLQPWCPEIF